MKIQDIKDPGFLKDLTLGELYDLSDDIRKFLIENIARTGGHLASNLGVVELTLALHYVFNSPEDKIIFDVGHQCYTHKILTGRADKFSTLRQYKGISGFQKRCESPHDVWEAGHSSTSLSAALGMAVARDFKHEDYHIVPVIGDGAIGSGMALEALNQIGSENRNIIIVFNDNNMSISKNVGALTYGFSKLRSSRGYHNLKANMKRNLRGNGFGEAVYSGLKSFKDAVKDAVIDGGIFEQFNLDYLGPVNGHNIKDLVQCFEVAKDHEGPIVIHVMTTKGKGYAPCERDNFGKWHGVSPFDVKTGKPLHSTPAGFHSWSDVMSSTVRELARKDDRIVAVTPAMIYGSSLQGFFAEFPERSFDCGIAEEHAATFSAGLAISGMRPYLEIYSSFLQRAYDQINHDICRMDLPVVIGVDHAGIIGGDGETHHGIFDIGLLTPLPNMIVAQPADGEEARNLLYTAFRQEHPFALRFPKGVVQTDLNEKMEEIPIGTWTVHHDAADNRIAVLTYGNQVTTILEKVISNDIPVTVVNCRFFKPLDLDVLRMLSERGMKAIVYETDMLVSGLGSRILEACCDNGIELPVKRFGIPDIYVGQGSSRQLRKEMGIDLNSLLQEIQREMDSF